MFRKHPRHTDDHDLLVIPKGGKLQQVQVDKREWVNGRPVRDGGTYVGLGPVSEEQEPGYRKAISVAQPSGSRSRGPTFACLPVKPEPASSFYTCFLVNADNLKFQNDWTSAEWNDEPDQLPAAPGEWRPVAFELLVAAQQGTVFHLTMKDGKVTSQEVDMQFESEIWSQLRNGVVVGSVRYEAHPEEPGRVVPLLNVTAVRS